MSVRLLDYTRIAQIRDILVSFSITRTVPGLAGAPSIFVAQTILEALGMTRGTAIPPRVAYIDVDLTYASRAGGVNICDEWHKFAQECPVVKEGERHLITLGEYSGAQIAHLIFKDGGVSVPFYLAPDNLPSD